MTFSLLVQKVLENRVSGGQDPDSNSFSGALSLFADAAKQTPIAEVLLNIHISNISGCAGEICFIFNSLCF